MSTISVPKLLRHRSIALFILDTNISVSNMNMIKANVQLHLEFSSITKNFPKIVLFTSLFVGSFLTPVIHLVYPFRSLFFPQIVYATKKEISAALINYI